ncbi:MAG: hypothetical protein KME64_32095 [Scytonematopsis contorta HA4267-MV1]|nr:hypothetical protein [Scytonematopsis contorta HA4267-MV1]
MADYDLYRYWNIYIIDTPKIINGEQIGSFKKIKLESAQQYFNQKFSQLANLPKISDEENKQTLATLLNTFKNHPNIRERALAGLCLRCYISQIIINVCRRLAVCNTKRIFTYTDLLPFVLNDDGKTLITVDTTGKIQLVLNPDDTTRPLDKKAEFYNVEILKKYNPDTNNKLNLNNWIYKLIPQQPELRLFLWEHGQNIPGKWSLLCTHISRQLEFHLTEKDYQIIQIFHSVYRRDRRNSQAKGFCKEPTSEQIQEMLDLLAKQNIDISPKQLKNQLENIAEIVHQDTVSKKIGIPKTELVNISDAYEELENISKYDLAKFSSYDPDLVEIERYQFLQFLQNSFEEVLYDSIAETINERYDYLKKSKAYKSFSAKFIEGLQFLYQDNYSLGEIAKMWDVPQFTAARVFKLTDFLDKCREKTLQKFLSKLLSDKIFQPIEENQITPDNLDYLSEAIREFLDSKTFTSAKTEMLASKKAIKKSIFAQFLCRHLNDMTHTACS